MIVNAQRSKLNVEFTHMQSSKCKVWTYDLDGLSKKKLFHANGEPNVQCFFGPGSMLCITELWVYFGPKALILCETKNRQKVVDSICESNIIPET